MIDIRPIESEPDYQSVLARTEERIDAELDVPATPVEACKVQHFYIGPVVAILFRMEQQRFERMAPEPDLGSRQRVSEILNRRRSLSLEMIQRLHEGLHIPLENLVGNAAQIAILSNTAVLCRGSG